MELNRDSKGRFEKGIRHSPKTEFKKGEHWRPSRVFRTKKYLFAEYITKQRSAMNIAKDWNITENAILFWLSKHNIPRRTMMEIRKNKKWGLSGKSNGMYGRCGSKNPRWIDGSSPERQKMYACSFWKELVKVVYERDVYKCIKCGVSHTIHNRLHAHHIKKWAGNPDCRFDLKNIITVCQKCHNWIHSKGNTNNEYLS